MELSNKKLNLNTKNMIEAYYNSKASLLLWDAFYKMKGYGFISERDWRNFFDACHAWFWNEDTQTICVSTSAGDVEVKGGIE